MSTRLQHGLDFILTMIGAAAGVASTLDQVEQIGRVILLFVSILSGLSLIIVNWPKAIAQIKKWLTK